MVRHNACVHMITIGGLAMQAFLERHADDVTGVLSGFDRILFRGSLLSISHVQGMNRMLRTFRIPFKNYGNFVQRVSQKIKTHAVQCAEREGRPMVHLDSPSICKEQKALEIAKRDDVQEGLICILTCVESCQTFRVYGNRKTGHLDLVPKRRKCLFYYFYYVDREFGLMHVRLQTWLPMQIQICLNGREYLARRLDRAGIAYEKRDNCFVHIADLAKAQRMLSDLESRNWVHFLSRYAHRVNPWCRPGNSLGLYDYYWTFRQSEYATDVMFRDEQALRRIYPALVRHAIEQFDCPNVLRFLGRGKHHLRSFRGKATTDRQLLPEGIRVKHRVDENSIKMYDKQGSVLRVETTIDNPRRFYVRRPKQDGDATQMAWLRMRKGVVDIARRVEISLAANLRYLEALAVVRKPSPTREVLDPISRRITRQGRPYRALRPLAPEESLLFAAVLSGDYHVQGFRNKDIRRKLNPQSERNPKERMKASGRTTRLFRLLRAHGLIRKVSGTFYYRVTRKGQHVMTTALIVRQCDLTNITT